MLRITIKNINPNFFTMFMVRTSSFHYLMYITKPFLLLVKVRGHYTVFESIFTVLYRGKKKAQKANAFWAF
jgi:hypothetical protein